jgi:D-alanyl-D-alanine carboxypeptidase
MMTLRAHALGMAQTEFYNASGLPNPNQVTTARDLSILARDIVVSFPEDQGFFEVQNYNFNGRTIYSNNAMLKLYPGASGMKTGYTILARHNLVTSAVRNGRVLIGVVLHEPSWGQTYSQMTAMLDAGFGGHIDGGNTMLAQNQPPAPAQPPVYAPQTYAPPAYVPPAPAPYANTSSQSGAASAPRPIQLAGRTPSDLSRLLGWTAQVGVYSHMSKARYQAIAVRQMRGVGIARIARVESHGRTLWTAQLAGLTLTAAHRTCDVLAAKGDSCLIIAPQADHLAMRDDGAAS